MSADVYIAMVSSAHNVCPKGYYIAIVSTIAENDANNHLELEPGFERLGEIEEKFFGPPIPIYEPLESGEKDNIFISKSYDATSHFETTTSKFCFEFPWISALTAIPRRRAGHVPSCHWRRAGGRGTPGRPTACPGVEGFCVSGLVGSFIARC